METTQFRVTDDILATNKIRFANYLIDLAVQYALLFGLVMVIVVISEVFDSYAFGNWIDSWGSLEEYLVGIVILLIYYSMIEMFFAQSVGKFITRTIVVLEDGSRPDKATIVKRTFCRLIPFNHLSFLGTPCRGWHDSISNTYVVNKGLLDQRMELHYSFQEIGQQTTS